ncbi:MAG: BamA/TamA family outer membrane protein [Bacteroidota bacterium]
MPAFRSVLALVPRLLTLALVVGLCAPPVAAQYGFSFGRNKVQYEDFDWHVLETEHFDVYYYPEMEELAEYGAAFAEEVYDELEHRFNFSLVRRVPVVFYATNLHFKQTNITPGFIPDNVGGFFEFLKGRVVVPSNGDLHRFRRVIRHELVHVFTFSKVRRAYADYRRPAETFIPLWFTEGIAEYWSGSADHNHEMIMRDAVASNFLVPLDNIIRIRGSYVMYKQGEAVCRWIGETYGDEKLLLMMENAWRDPDFTKVIEHVLQEDFETLSERWDEWVRAQYVPDVEGADVTSLVAQPVQARGYSMKPALWTDAEGQRHVVYAANKNGYTNLYRVAVDSAMAPVEDPRVVVEGERSAVYEAFHMFDSRHDVNDEGHVVFVTKSGGTDVVHVFDMVEERRLHTFAFDDLVAIYSPHWSPDGRRLAFTGIARSGFSDLYVYDLADDRLARLTDDAYDDRDPAWSPDGTRLVFSSDRTAFGHEGAYNLFTYTFEEGAMDAGALAYLTYGPHLDLSPRWTPDGTRVVYTSTVRDEATGRFTAQDLWTVEAESATPLLARTSTAAPTRQATRLTRFTSASFDPVWTDTDRIVFASFENFRFTIRTMDARGLVDDPVSIVAVRPALDRFGPTAPLLAQRETAPASPRSVVMPIPDDDAANVPGGGDAFAEDGPLAETPPSEAISASVALRARVGLSWEPPEAWAARPVATSPDDRTPPEEGWAFDPIPITEVERQRPYKRAYNLDIAQGGVSTNPVWGTSGGAVLAFSDMLGNDRWYVSAFQVNTPGRSFWEGLNVSVSRLHLGRRANFGYGAFRLGGRRFDRGDPDAAATYPVFFEEVWGGFGAVSYPLSKFRRVELGTSAAWSQKDQITATETLESVLVSNSVALVHDTALYGFNGPVDGWRGNLTVGYTTDVLNANVNYVTLSADLRHYLRIVPGLTFASWGLAQSNIGRRSRLFLLGGSWNLRGFGFLDVRARNILFTSQELRFPLVVAPGAILPILAPFGLANIRGAAFFDAAHAWNDDFYSDSIAEAQLNAGRTLGATGLGLRFNLFGAFVLRYDRGFRFRDGIQWDEREAFSQFFFGYDF